MSNCCHSQSDVANTRNPGTCPVSGTRGAPVQLDTVKALLTETALRTLDPGSYRFCADPSCAVVYFDDAGHSLLTDDLRVRVWQKEPFGTRMVCYCFGENEADIRNEVERDGRSRAVERVTAHIQAGRCACEIRNPRGTCCLGDVRAAVTRVAHSLESHAGNSDAAGRGASGRHEQ